MDDKIYYGNLKGLLKTGRWSLNLEEASALLSLYKETEKRLDPKLEVIKHEPKPKPKRVRKAKS